MHKSNSFFDLFCGGPLLWITYFTYYYFYYNSINLLKPLFLLLKATFFTMKNHFFYCHGPLFLLFKTSSRRKTTFFTVENVENSVSEIEKPLFLLSFRLGYLLFLLSPPPGSQVLP